jgi:hypothetical protein
MCRELPAVYEIFGYLPARDDALQLANLAVGILLPQAIADAQCSLRSNTEGLIAPLFVAILPLVKQAMYAGAEQRSGHLVGLGIAYMQRGKRIKVLGENCCERGKRRRRRALRSERAYAGKKQRAMA